MSTENNTLKNDLTPERKEECEAELIELPPDHFSYDYDKDLGSDQQPVDDDSSLQDLSTETSSLPDNEPVEEAKESGEESKNDEAPEIPKDPETKEIDETTGETIPEIIPTPPKQIYKPNTLTILINTKIRNHRMLYYKPYMTTPGESSKHVCFDPLVKLNQSIVNRIPENSPKDEIYTQFFRRNEFNSLLKRTLSQSMQPIYTFEDAREGGVTDHNIKVTLDTLFKEGNQFYINGESYVVNGFDWVQGDWEIDTRPHYQNQVRFLPFGVAYPKGYIHNFGNEAMRERRTIPVEAMKGDALLASSKIKKAIENSTSNIAHQPSIKIGEDMEVKKYSIPNIFELVELKETNPEAVPTINLDENEQPQDEEAVRPQPAETVSEDLEIVDPVPDTEPTIIENDPVPGNEEIITPSPDITVDPEPEPEPEPEPIPDDLSEDSEIDVKEPDPLAFPTLDEDDTELSDNEKEKQEIEKKTEEEDNKQEQQEEEKESNEGKVLTKASQLPNDILYLIMNFAKKRPLPGEVLSEQFERYLIQEAARGFFTKACILRIFDVLKKENDTYDISLKGDSPNQEGVKRNLDSWDIEENDGKGDCMFTAMSQILNGGESDSTFKGRDEYKVDGKYTSHSVRRAVSDYLRGEGRELFDLYRSTVDPDLPTLVKKQDEQQPLLDSEKETIMVNKFMLNDDNSDFMDDEMIIDRMSKPSDENNFDVIESSEEEITVVPYDKHYWGDELTIQCFENIFNTKIIMIAKYDTSRKRVFLNSRVEFKENNETMFGTVRKLSEDDSIATIITDNYVNYEKPVNEVEIMKLYSIHPTLSSLTINKSTQIGFLFYHMNGSQGHYESIYKKGVSGRQVDKRKYKFPITKTSLPSFIVYMLFLSVYGFDQNNEFTALRQDPIYTAEYISKNESNPIRSMLNDMYKIYSSNLQGEETRSRRLSLQMGGKVKPYVTTYLQNSMNVDTKNTYYIVVDLDLYPGTSLTSGQKFRLSCSHNYDRMRSAWADIFGLQYEPGELDTSSVQSPMETQASAPPMAEAVPVQEAKGGAIRKKTYKKPYKHRYTKHARSRRSNKKTRIQKKKIRHRTRRSI